MSLRECGEARLAGSVEKLDWKAASGLNSSLVRKKQCQVQSTVIGNQEEAEQKGAYAIRLLQAFGASLWPPLSEPQRGPAG